MESEKLENQVEKGEICNGALRAPIASVEGICSQGGGGVGACPQKILKNWSSNMRFSAFLGMFIAKKMRGSYNRLYVKN